MSRAFPLWSILAVLVMSATAHALMASPAAFETRLKTSPATYVITVTNDEQRTLDVTITPTGPLAPYLTIPSGVTLAPGERKLLTVTLLMPEDTQPGTLESGILFEGRLPSAGTVGASSAVLHIIRLETPREGAFLSGEILFSSPALNQPVALTVTLTNTGTEDLRDVKVSTTVDNQTTSSSVPLLPVGTTKNILVSWTPKRAGEFPASARISYAGKETTLSNAIVVGNRSVLLLGVEPGAFRLGDPFRLSVFGRNEWSERIPVVAQVSVVQGNATVAAGSSTAVLASPSVLTEVPVFLESGRMSLGAARVDVNLSYGGATESLSFPLYVNVDSLSKSAIAPSVPIGGWIALFLIAISIAGATWYYGRRRKRRRE